MKHMLFLTAILVGCSSTEMPQSDTSFEVQELTSKGTRMSCSEIQELSDSMTKDLVSKYGFEGPEIGPAQTSCNITGNVCCTQYASCKCCCTDFGFCSCGCNDPGPIKTAGI